MDNKAKPTKKPVLKPGKKRASKTAKRLSAPSEQMYPPHSILSTGLGSKCPRCAQGALFQSMIKTVKKCAVCDLDMAFAEEGDGPAVFVILILGIILVAMALFIEVTFKPPFWVHIILWIPATLFLSLWGLKLIKGVMVAAQYKTGASEGKRVR